MLFNRGIFYCFCLVLYFILKNESKAQDDISLNELNAVDFRDIESKFTNIPSSVQTSVYWYWISDHLSKEGVIKDLHAMKSVGINRAFIGNIGLDNIPYGKVKIFSDEWWEILHTALKTATDLNIEIGIFNSPGWSQSGGPWVKSEQSMRYLSLVDTCLVGDQHFKGKLSATHRDFQHVKTLAFRTPDSYSKVFDKEQLLSVDAKPQIQNLTSLFDQDLQNGVILPKDKDTVKITIDSKGDFLARSLTLFPFAADGRFSVRMEILADKEYVPVRTFEVDRRNTSFNVGFERYAPVSVSFKDVKSKSFRLVIYGIEGAPGISKIEFSAAPKIEYYKEKTLAKMHPTPLPYWEDYLWPIQEEIYDKTNYLDADDIIDITSYVGKNGELSWDVPNGNWKIIHTGMLPTGVTNGPATEEGTGLEVDKMNHHHVIAHFDAFLGEIQRRIPEEDRRTWKVAVQDSYETGSQNWTDDFEEKFSAAFGYDPTPYIPAVFGYVVNSQDHSDRFLWDLRRFIADKIAYEYVGGLREVSHKHGLTIWLENYGHWGFPGEFLQYGGQSDEIGGEFWNEGELGDIENKAASSAAHIYGKTKVSAESFTASGNTFGRYPALLKARADRFFTEGINNTLLHVYIHQPYEDKKPGVNTWFGTEFNRHNTWFYDMDIFIEYLKRCNFMLQQGKYVADVAYFIGEDVPKMTGIQNPVLPKGYSFDYMNAEVILNRMDVKNGMFTLPDGMQYKVLVLPELETIRPEILMKIVQMVEKGGTILGPKPKRSPSLSNMTQADSVVQYWADRLWGTLDADKPTVNNYGQGKVFSQVGLEEVFVALALSPDFVVDQEGILFTHRKLADGDIYFISNQNERKIDFTAGFRINGGLPEIWDPIQGKTRKLSTFSKLENKIEIPLTLDVNGSCFVLFRKGAVSDYEISETKSNPSSRKLAVREIGIVEPWKIIFHERKDTTITLQSLIDWKDADSSFIRHFSGTATYYNSFFTNELSDDQNYTLDLGDVKAIAKIKVNDRYVGGVWTYPYSLDITDYVVKGQNKIEIKVVNAWANGLIGDQSLDEKDRLTWAIENPYTKESPLHSSGLLGPVKIDIYEN